MTWPKSFTALTRKQSPAISWQFVDRCRRYGLAPKQFVQMHRSQRGGCKICRTQAEFGELCIDHNHRSGQVRGLLCTHCNLGLGHFRDQPLVARRAANYLEEQKVTHLIARYSLRFAVSVVAPVAAYAIQEHLLPRIVSTIEAWISKAELVAVADANPSVTDLEEWDFWG